MKDHSKTAFVTGAARGLGKAISERFLRDGCRVAAFDRNSDDLPAVAREWKAEERVLTIVGDVRNRSDVQRAVDEVVDRWGRIDILANVAGIAR